MDITINLAESTYAHGFNENELIHKDEFDAVMNLIRGRYDSVKPDDNDSGHVIHRYNTISVFGERGSGKTSFLYSVVKALEKSDLNVEVLSIIDPTMMEEKEHIFLLVVSLINDTVRRKLAQNECRHKTTSFQLKSKWEVQLQKLAKGLPTLDKVGADHKTHDWQSHEYIMERGLDTVHSAFDLESEFHQLVSLALDILDKNAFLLMLDDIDVDMHKGWDVLEMLRRYITTSQIITLLSGNLKLYSLNVRKHQWKQLEENTKFEPNMNYVQTVNELEGQYLLKVLKPENRIHLSSMEDAILNAKYRYVIRKNDGSESSIQEVYQSILSSYGIKGVVQQKVFINYLMSLSIRTQIQFIKGNMEGINTSGNIEAFLSRLYAANVPVNVAMNNVEMVDVVIQRYLEEQKSMPDLYLLTPNSGNDDMNACLTAFTMLYARNTAKHPFLLFDFYIRMGYMRNVRLGISDEHAKNFYDRTGFSQQMLLKNNVGLSQAYCHELESLLTSHTTLPGLAGKDKKGIDRKEGRIDYEVKENANYGQGVIAHIPLSVLRFTERNDTKVMYSFYSLMAAISDLLKSMESNTELEIVKSELQNLQVMRSYPTWTRETASQKHGEVDDYGDQNYRDDTVTVIKEGDDTLGVLAQELITWSKGFKETVPPYLVGIISTRAYYAIQKISRQNLGDQMHRVVVAFLNACLVEEMREYYVKTVETESIERLNTSNAITDDKVLLNNIDFVLRNKALSKIKLTVWMAKCPLLGCFVKPGTFAGKIFKVGDGETTKETKPFEGGHDERLNVYELLSEVTIKDKVDDSRPTFSGSETGFKETAKVLTEAGKNPQELAEDTRSPEVIAEEIKSFGIFAKKPSSNSIKSFQSNFKKMMEAAEWETATSATESPNDDQPDQPAE